MAIHPVIGAKGVYTADNELADVPPGACVRADNAICQYKGVLESRRGQKFLKHNPGSGEAESTFGALTDRGNEGFWYGSTLLQHYGSSKLTSWDATTGFADVSGSYTPPDAATLRMKFAEFALNLYFTTAAGIYTLDAVGGTPVAAGVPRPMSLTFKGATGSSGNQPDNTQVAFRAVWGFKDANNNVKLSAPSQRIVVANAALQVAIGGLSRTGTTVTVTFTGDQSNLANGASITLSPGETNFPAGTYTVTSVGTGTLTYTNAGSATTSTAAQEILTGSRDNLIAVGIPSGVGANHFFRLYRSKASAGRLLPPDDELYQSFEGHIPKAQTATVGNLAKSASTTATATITAHGFLEGQQLSVSPGETNFPAGEVTIFNVTANTFQYILGPSVTATNTVDQTFSAVRFVVVKDDQPEDLLGGPLYTNPNTGDGIEAANYPPPLAKDICTWDNRLWLLNTTEPQRFTMYLLGVGLPDGLQANDSVTIANRQYTAKATGPLGTREFLLYSSGTASQNIERTARNLIDAINQDDDQVCYAYYVSEADDTPGAILLEGRTVSSPSFSVIFYRSSSFAPAQNPNGEPYLSSVSDARQNGISYSKRGQPEAVPLTNWESVGPKNRVGLRVLPLRDKLVIFLKGAGIWTVSKSGAGYRIDELDGTAQLLAPDSAVKLNNQIFAYTSQGVVCVSDAGVRVLSGPIDDELLELWGAAQSAVRRYAFGVSAESDRQYQLWLPAISSDTICQQAWVFNTKTEEWTHWTESRSWGRVHPLEDLLYLGDGESNRVRLERKSFDRTDYADEDIAVTITAHSGATVTLTTVAGLAVGDLLAQDTTESLIEDIDTANNILTLATTEYWTNSAAVVRVAITNTVKLAPAVPLGPGMEKLFTAVQFHFRKFVVGNFSATFDTEIQRDEVSPVPLQSTGFGQMPFGQFTFGNSTGLASQRAEVPAEYNRATQIRVGWTLREAHALWAFLGYSLEYQPVSEKTGRG